MTDNTSESSTVTESLGTVFNGASLFAVGFALANAFGFFTQILLTRLLGPSAYGILSFAQTGHYLARSVSNLGSNKSLMRYLPANRDAQSIQEGYLTMAYATSLLASVAVATLIIVFAPIISRLTLNDPIFIRVLQIFAIILIFDTMMQVTSNVFRALEMAKFDILIRKTGYQGFLFLAAAVSFLLGLHLFETVLTVAAASAATFISALVLASRHMDITPSWTTKRIDLRSYYQYSLPLSAKDMGHYFYTRTDIIMVGIFFSSSDVGIYNAAIMLGMIITLPIPAVGQLFPPIASRLYSEGDADKLHRIYATVSRWSLTCSLPLALGAIVYREELLLLFGPEFTAGGAILAVLALGYIVDSLGAQTGYLLMMTDHQYLVFANQWAAALLNIGLSYFLILEFGVIGAAYASAAVLASINLLRVIEIWYFEEMTPLSRGVIKPFIAAIPASVTMVVLRSLGVSSPLITMFVTGAIGIVAYAIALAALGIEEEDRMLYNSI